MGSGKRNYRSMRTRYRKHPQRGIKEIGKKEEPTKEDLKELIALFENE